LEEPEPFAVEIDFGTDPRSVRQMTNEIDLAGAQAREARQGLRQEVENKAVESLKDDIRRRAEAGKPPMAKEQDAVPLLRAFGLTRPLARELLVAGDGKHWKLAPDKGKHGRALTVLPVGSNRDGGGKANATEAAKTEGAEGHTSRRPHEQATARNDSDETVVSTGCDEGAVVAAEPKCSGGELPFEGF